MNKDLKLKKQNINLGGFTMGLAFFKSKDLLSRYRRKTSYLSNNSFNNDLDYFIIFNKHI